MQFQREGYAVAPDGHRLWYGISGNLAGAGVPIVCANGIGCSIYFWKYIQAYFGANAPVLVWDYRGHGASDEPADPRVTLGQCADDMQVVMRAAGLSRALLIGHSMGSQVILEFYRRYPELAAGLVPLLGGYGRTLDTFFDSSLPKRVFPFIHGAATAAPELLGRLTGLVLNPALAFAAAHRLGIINGAFADPRDMTDYFKHIARVPVDLFFHLAKDAGEHTCEDILGDIDVPVLVIGAEHDKFTPLWLSEAMQKAIPGSELLVIREGSHAALIEHPELINLRLEKFIRERISQAQRGAARSRARAKA